jgi:hypothetical protein
MSQETELLIEIRDLLKVIAEPILAKRDAKLRSALRAIVGSSETKALAVSLMDGTRSQAALVRESGMDQGYLSRLVKSLGDANLIATEQKKPRLLLQLPRNFFEGDDSDDE